MRQFTGMEKERIQFYFNCPEKMEYIEKMIKHTNYKDIVFTLVFTGPTVRPAGIRSRLGRNVVLWVVLYFPITSLRYVGATLAVRTV